VWTDGNAINEVVFIAQVRFHSKDEIEHQAVLARNTERTVLMVLK
jgi:hypothetical protein